ncbi:hypothetical protein ANRL2_02676 [Anaerolineae bacterium]|nr:hypothetical protein ANRL2_02676 [Anaerolineae bacterium]
MITNEKTTPLMKEYVRVFGSPGREGQDYAYEDESLEQPYFGRIVETVTTYVTPDQPEIGE